MTFSKVTRYKINKNKNQLYFYILTTKIKNLNTITTIITPKSKILRYSSNKQVQDLYTENYKMLINKIKDLKKGRDIPHSHIGRMNKEKQYSTMSLI